jgi:outer membrane protein assembly factor BamB
VDDSPLAADGLIRAGELAAVGNLDEAVRVLQGLLDTEAERLLASPGDPDLFTSVRGRVHEALLKDPALLDRYRALEDPPAQRLLAAGEADTVERTRLLTPTGFEAALRLAQRRLEAAQFHGAMQTLAQLERHPDRTGALAVVATELLLLAASYVDTPASDDAERLARWSHEAPPVRPRGARAETPEIHPVRTAFTAAPETDLSDLLPRPLWSDTLGERLPLDSSVHRPAANPPKEQAQWLFASPTVVGDTVYVNDTQTITAWNRFTLSQKWRVKLDGIQGRRYAIGPTSNFEELSSVSADATYVVALTGLAIQNTDTPRRALVCMDQRNGRVLWNRVLDEYRIPEFEESRFRGPAVLDQGLVLILVEKDVSRRRLEGAYFVALDAGTGSIRWIRPLGSSGSLAYGSRPPVLDAPSIDRGVAYIANRLGFVACVETVSGRVRWIRRWAGTLVMQQGADQPWESNSPVVTSAGIFTVTPDRAEIVLIDAATGEKKARCPATKFQNPDYLLVAGDALIGMGDTAAIRADLTDFGPAVATRRFAEFSAGQVRGRAIVFGDRIMVPVLDGVRLYDPKGDLKPLLTLPLDKPGTVLPLDGQLLVVDDQEVHTYLVWDVADRMLRRRMEEEVDDPTAAITYAELSYRAGRPDGILPAVDRALAVVERDPLAPTLETNQSRLFRAIFSMVEPPSDAAGRATLPLALRRSLIERLDRCAGGVTERVAYLLAAGRFHEATDQPARAVEAYQSVLDSTDLAAASFTQGQTVVSADFEATRRLRRLIQTHSTALYEPYQPDADRALAGLAQALDPEPFEALARRYPIARASVSAWLEAASRYTSQGRARLAAQALEEGLASARLALGPADPMLGELTGRLVQHFARAGLHYSALTMLESFARETPGLALTEHGAVLNLSQLTSEIRREIEALNRRPRIGPNPVGAAAIIGWGLLPPYASDSPPSVTDRVMMLSEEDEIAMFRASGAGVLEKAWGGIKNEEYLWMDPRGVAFARGTDAEEDRRDWSLVRRDLETGRVLWETPYFRTLFAPGPIDRLLADPAKPPVPVMDSPLEARKPVTDIFVRSDRNTIVMTDRTGRTAAIDLDTGRVLWSSDKTVPRLHDAALDAGTLLIGGAEGEVDLAPVDQGAKPGERSNGVVMALDARTGQTLHRWETPERVRWVRLAPEGFSVIGLDNAVISLDAYRGRVRWRAGARALAQSLAAWTFPGRVIVRSDSNDLFQIETGGGAFRENALDTRDRLAGGFGSVRITPLGGDTALATTMGLAVFDSAGDLAGLNASEQDDEVIFGDFGERYAVTVTPTNRAPDEHGEMAVNINLFSIPTLKAVSRTELPLGDQAEPGPGWLIDGKLLVQCGGITTVIDLPATQ